MVQVLYLIEVFILADYGPPSTETPTTETTAVQSHKNSWIYLTSTYYWWLLRPTITIRFDSKWKNTVHTALNRTMLLVDQWWTKYKFWILNTHNDQCQYSCPLVFHNFLTLQKRSILSAYSLHWISNKIREKHEIHLKIHKSHKQAEQVEQSDIDRVNLQFLLDSARNGCVVSLELFRTHMPRHYNDSKSQRLGCFLVSRNYAKSAVLVLFMSESLQIY